MIRSYQTTLIPDLLQTPEYAHTLHPGDDTAVHALIERQAALTRDEIPRRSTASWTKPSSTATAAHPRSCATSSSTWSSPSHRHA